MFASPDRLVNWQRRQFPDVPWLGSAWHRRTIRAQGAITILVFAFALTGGLLAQLAVPLSVQVLTAVLVATATFGALPFLGSSSK